MRKSFVKNWIKTAWIVLAIVAVVLVSLWIVKLVGRAKASSDAQNASYIVEGALVKLANGLATVETSPGSATKTTVRYFGNDAKGDLNGDGRADIAFILTSDSSGSGMFYYAAVALGSESGYRGTNAVFLGDRIAPQTTQIRDGIVIVNYSDRKPDEPMTISPSVGKSMRLHVSDGKLLETK
ncbi:MAG TPA: hypothetical protein VHE10_02900 [Candidatus Paceibacterota bacterium]|nr:hypothetical protein [Candidatus Paceibacterota bacterium]